MQKKIIKRKLLLGAVILIIAAAGYYGYKAFFGNKNATAYVTAPAKKSTLVVSVAGTGQVAVSDQIDLKPRVSGNAVYIGLAEGQAVGSGALILKLDTIDAEKAVRDAKVALASAQLNLEKLRGPDASSTAPRNKINAESDLAQAYSDGFNNVANAFLDLPTVMTGLQDVLYGTELNSGQANINFYNDAVINYNASMTNYFDSAGNDYQTAFAAYNGNFSDYKNTSRFDDVSKINALIDETYTATQSVSQALKSASNLIQFYEDQLTALNKKHAALADTQITNLNVYIGKINTDLLNLLNSKNAIKTDQDAVANADLDVKSQELAVQQQQNALADAQANLNYYYIRAPFDGIIAKIDVKIGDPVSPSTVIGSFITHQKIANISLNEVDVAKVADGQKVTLTFDAVPGLTIAGQVAEVDTLGTVTQGVVTYNVKVAFDTQDQRVKDGMTANAAIITATKENALVVPNAAIKSEGNAKYVNILPSGAPSPESVQVGVGASNDTETEITSGLNEGDRVVTRIISSSSQAPAQQAPNIFGGLGGNRGGAVQRIQR